MLLIQSYFITGDSCSAGWKNTKISTLRISFRLFLRGSMWAVTPQIQSCCLNKRLYHMGIASSLFLSLLHTTMHATFFFITNLFPKGFPCDTWLGQQPLWLLTCLISTNCPLSSTLFLSVFSLHPSLLSDLSSAVISPNSYLLFHLPSPLQSSPLSPRRPTTAAGVPGVLGVRAPELAEAGCSSPNACATTRHHVTTGVTARGREPSIGPATSHHVQHQVSVTAWECMHDYNSTS